ncbi:MAG: WYL domain-containing protein [Bergeyella sp.]
MAKTDQLFRLMNIVEFLRSRQPDGATYQEILTYLEERHYADGFDLAFSEKTFNRDRQMILEHLKTEIKFKRSTMTYQIVNEEDYESTQNIFDNLLLINAYKQTENNSKIMFFEKRQASGLHNLEGIIYAIKNSKIISFDYTKYWENTSQKRVLQPYALKEFRNRWYLLANELDGKDFFIKTFGLDRISDMEIHNKTFKKQTVDVEAMFVNSFGIISTLNEKPEKIILSFDAEQGKYVKSLPIHHSQKVLADNVDEYKIELTLVPTYDFYQELLTHAERVRIEKPLSVRKEYLKVLKIAEEMNLF